MKYAPVDFSTTYGQNEFDHKFIQVDIVLENGEIIIDTITYDEACTLIRLADTLDYDNPDVLMATYEFHSSNTSNVYVLNAFTLMNLQLQLFDFTYDIEHQTFNPVFEEPKLTTN